MGAEQSSDASFAELYAALPEEGRARINEMAERESTTLLSRHPAAPDPSPTVPVGITMRLRHAEAREALSIVPRLQRKHYEMIPKAIDEADFFVSI